MARKIVFLGPVAVSSYMVLFSRDGEVWNGAAFEPVDGSHWDSYVLPLVQTGGAPVYMGEIPLGVPPSPRLTAVAYCRQGALPSVADVPIDDYRLDWEGGEFVTAFNTRVDLNQPVPALNLAGSVGEALSAARAVGFGKWELAGNEWRLYAPDGLTRVATLHVDDPASPSVRE